MIKFWRQSGFSKMMRGVMRGVKTPWNSLLTNIVRLASVIFVHKAHHWALYHKWFQYKSELEALRERRPPWPRQIITPILPTVKMLSLGCERLPTPLKKKKKKKKKKGSGSFPSPRSGYATTITVYFCSFTHLTIPRSPLKFNQFLLVLLRTRP